MFIGHYAVALAAKKGAPKDSIGTLVLSAEFSAGIVLYLRATRARDRIGIYGFWSLIALLMLIYLSNFFGPPPPDKGIIAIVGNAAWVFVSWCYWIDHHRSPSP